MTIPILNPCRLLGLILVLDGYWVLNDILMFDDRILWVAKVDAIPLWQSWSVERKARGNLRQNTNYKKNLISISDNLTESIKKYCHFIHTLSPLVERYRTIPLTLFWNKHIYVHLPAIVCIIGSIRQTASGDFCVIVGLIKARPVWKQNNSNVLSAI
jgi:hypothetical protein